MKFKKASRKQREKGFKRLPKTEHPSIRLDKYDNMVDFFHYNCKTDLGWGFDDKGDPVHWRELD